MNEEDKKYLDDTREYWQDFPESPVSDTFKWIDSKGFSHMITLRAYSPHLLFQQINKTISGITDIGGKPDGQTVTPAKAVQERDEGGLPVVDGEGKPVMIPLPAGTSLYTVKGFYHGQNKDKTKDFLKVVVEEKPHNSKYGLAVFHAPFSEWKAWSIFTGDGAPGLFAPAESYRHVVIREPAGEGQFPEIVEFRT